MSQSTESTTETNPFTRPGFIIAAALVAALIAATLVIFLLPKDQNNAQTAPGTPQSGTSAPMTSPGTVPAADESICGLPSSPDTALGTAPKTKWELVGKMAAPTEPKTFGPGITDGDRFRSCFSQSPTGALYAAANMVALGSLSDAGIQQKLVEKLVAPGPGRDAALKNIKVPSGSASSSIQLRGFILKTYSPAAADVDLAFQTSDGALAHGVLPLRWADGDWKVEISDSGELINDTAQIRDLSGFIPWSGA